MKNFKEASFMEILKQHVNNTCLTLFGQVQRFYVQLSVVFIVELFIADAKIMPLYCPLLSIYLVNTYALAH